MLLIALTKTLPFWFSTSQHCDGNTINFVCHVSEGSFPPVTNSHNSPSTVYLKHKFDKGMRELNKCEQKELLKVKFQIEVLAFGTDMFEILQIFNNSKVKLTPCFLCITYS